MSRFAHLSQDDHQKRYETWELWEKLIHELVNELNADVFAGEWKITTDNKVYGYHEIDAQQPIYGVRTFEIHQSFWVGELIIVTVDGKKTEFLKVISARYRKESGEESELSTKCWFAGSEDDLTIALENAVKFIQSRDDFTQTQADKEIEEIRAREREEIALQKTADEAELLRREAEEEAVKSAQQAMWDSFGVDELLNNLIGQYPDFKWVRKDQSRSKEEILGRFGINNFVRGKIDAVFAEHGKGEGNRRYSVYVYLTKDNIVKVYARCSTSRSVLINRFWDINKPVDLESVLITVADTLTSL